MIQNKAKNVLTNPNNVPRSTISAIHYGREINEKIKTVKRSLLKKRKAHSSGW